MATELMMSSSSPLSDLVIASKLVDIQWKFGVTAASSESNSVGTTFLQLRLTLRRTISKNAGSSFENVYLEMTLPQFYSFLHEMERAKANMDHLK